MAKDLTETFKPEAKSIMKVFCDADSYYQVPDYQRPYSWEDEQIETLWDDIYSALESKDESYFLGPMILIRTKKGYFEVVDGQQRLTTLSILFCVLRDLYFKNNKRILDVIKSLVDQKYRLRLITQSHYQNQFEQEILNEVKFPEYELTKKEREKNTFMNAALIFRDRLKEIEDKGNKTISKFVDYLLNQVIMITITCSNQSFAIKLFQVLNTRGLDLTNTDLIKSYLYGKLDSERKRQQFTFTWSDIETVSKQIGEDLEDLFTYYEYYLLARNPKYSLYDELIRTKMFKADPNKVIYNIKEFIDNFSKVSRLESKIIFSFWYLPNQFFWKAILTSAKEENFHDFKGLCKEIRKIYYCYWIAGYTTSKIKQLSFNLISWIKHNKKLSEIKKEIDEKMTDDNVFKWMSENLKNDVYGKSWLKPLLVLIEYEQTDDSKLSFIELDRNLHVDHILPIKWGVIKYWKERWTKEQAEASLHKLGNLTLLSGKKNISASNDSFDNKKKIYKGKGIDGTTAFLISQEIIRKHNWLENNVKSRQKLLIKQLETIFDVRVA